MDGREVQGQHSRGFFDGVNSQLGHHPQGLHSTGLPHENLFGMHPSLQQIYPFGVRRSSIPSVSGSASDLSNTIGLGNDSSSRIPSTLGSPTLNTPSMGGPGWWLPPGFSAGLPTSDIHSSFSQMPWNNHDQDPLLSGHESLGSMHPHTSHLRGNLPNGMLPVSSIGNSPYLPHSRGSSSLHSGTLIHFPHSTGQSVVKSDPPWALGGSETLSHSAKANTALEFSHKESSRRKDLTNDPLLSGGLDTANKVRHPEISASSSNSAVLKTNNDILDDPFNLDLNPFDENIPSVRGIDKPGPALPKSQEPPRSFSQDAPKKSEQVQVQENPSYKLPEPRTARFHPQASQHEQFSRKAGPNSQQSQRQQFSRKESESSHPSQYEQFSRKESQPSKSFSDLPSVSMPTKLSENTPKERFSSQKKSAPVQSTHLSTPVANSKQTSHPPHSSGALENTPFPSKQGSSVEIWHNLELNSSRDFDSSAEDSDFFPGQSPPKNAKAGLSLENQNLTLEFQEKPKKELPFYDSPLNSTLPPQTSTNSGNKNDLDQKTAAKSSRRPFSVDFLSVSSGSEKKGEKLTPGTDTKQREVSKGIVTNSTSSDRISVIKAAPQVTQAKEVVRNTNIYANTQALNSRSSASKPAVATAAEVKTPPPSSEVKMTVMPRPPTLPIPPPAVPKPLIATFKGMPYNSQDAKDEEESKSSSSESGSEEESESEEEEESEVEEEEEEEEEEDDDEEKQENDESKDESEEDSGEESDAESSEEEESEDEDELEMDDDSKQGESASQDLSPGKRKANDHGAHPAKRRKVVDEELIKLPLAKGWRRQTRLRPTGSGDVLRGDVYYFSPCGKKLRTYPEVSKYLEKNNVRDLKLDNFTFSTKVTVGEFLEAKQGSKFEVLSEEEVQRRHQLEKDRQRKREEQLQKKKDKKRLQAEMARKAQEARQRKKLERQAASEAAKAQKKAKEEEKVRSKIERQQALEAAKQAKKERERLIAEQRRIAKERAKQEREMDRLRKLEEKRLEKEMKLRSIQEEKMRKKELLRMEREMRARQIQEAKERKKEAIHQAKMEEAVRKAREREMKRQQAEAMKSQEKERRKQHMMMVRALESQRKAEERERKKEEKRLEKRLLKQRKMEQKRLERQIARELKKPVDDMALNDGKALPDFPRVKGVSIPGEAYANLMMVEEFVWCFGHVLDIDPETDFPSLADLQNSLLSECLKKNPLITACKSLLKTALSDPGSAGLSATNELGVALENIELTEFNVSEVLRLFILSRNERNSQELATMLEEKPLQSLSPVSKSQVLAFIVNELLCTSSIYKEIENSLDHMSNLRRDKWNMEGTIRKLKADLKTKKVSQGNSQPTDSQSSDRHLSSTPSKSKASNLNKSLNLHDSSSQDTTADDEVSNTGSTMTKDDQDEDDDDDDDEEEEEEEEEGDDDDKDSDDEDDDDDDQADDDDEEEESDDSDDETEPTTVEDIEKKVEKLEKKHSKYRHKLFTASHTLRALSLGQDRFHRRYYVLPHAGGVYVEAIESGELRDSLETVDNKNIFDSKKHIKEEPSNSETSGGPCIDQKNETVDLKSPITGGPPVKPGPMSPIGSPRLSSPVHGQFNIGNQTPTEPRPGNLTINTYSGKDSITSPNRWTNLLSPTRTQQGYLHSPPGVKPSRTKWFRVFPQAPCDETSLTRSSLIPQSPNATKPIVPPNVKLLSQDRGFIESVYSRDFSSSLTTSPSGGYGLTQQNFGGQMMSNPHFEGSVFSPGIPAVSSRYPGVNAPHPQTLKPVEGAPEGMSKAALLGLPPGTDLHKLIEQDPQKAAILLEIQSSEPQPVPEDKRYGWWRIVESDQIHKLLKTLHTRGFREKMLQKSINRHIEYACSSCKKKRDAFCLEDGEDEDDKDQNAEQLKSPKSPKKHRKMVEISSNGKIEDKWLPHVAFQMEKAILVDVEELEEKLCSASLQSKTWRPCAKVSQNLSTNLKNDTKPKEEEKPLELAKRRLLALECGIERRYLKHPFRVDKLAIPPPKSDPFQFPPDDDEPQPKILSSSEQITDGLKLWRKTVSECTSAAQLAMCVNMLRECIAWEKSIMKVICLECGKCDNEELLLLCDQCDRGTHSYCCKPKLTIIPDGDWFCRECIMMASGSDQCYGCNSANGKRLKCEYCPRYYHMQCLDPPLQKTPRAPWACPTCKKARQKSRGGSRRKKRPEDEFVEKPEKLAKPKKAKPVVDGRNNRKQAMKDMAPCQTMLAEMERHEDSWPFLVPVNAKQFPEYYQIIKHPMDFHTMKVKLRDFQYASRDEFAGDARLVFNNCDFFNEDDSEVGQAGKRMLKFFNKRWPEIKKAADQEEQEESESSSSESDSSSSSEETDSSEEEEEDEEEEEESK